MSTDLTSTGLTSTGPISADTRVFWDRLADKYARSAISDEDAYRKKLEATQRHFTPGMNILEIGCGTGGTAREHAPHVAHVLATDISPRMIAIARERTEGTGLENVAFEAVGYDQIEAPEGGFDAVLALSVLHLVPDPTEALRHIHGLMKPGGVFVSSTPCLKDGAWFLPIALPVAKLLGKAPPVVHFFAGETWEQMIATAGFRVDSRLVQGGWAGGRFLIAVRD